MDMTTVCPPLPRSRSRHSTICRDALSGGTVGTQWRHGGAGRSRAEARQTFHAVPEAPSDMNVQVNIYLSKVITSGLIRTWHNLRVGHN